MEKTNLITPLELKELRESLGLSQQAFAKKIGVTRAYFNQIETGEREITSTFQKKIDRYKEGRAETTNPDTPGLPIEVLLSVNKWAAQAGVSPKEFIVLCLMNHGRTMLSEIIAGQIISEKADEILKEQKEREARERRDKGSGQS